MRLVNTMKIGILTFHSAYNFGALLQCYALFSTLRECGYDVEVIDYCPNYLATKKEHLHWHTFINKTPWKIIERVQAVLSERRRYELFKGFVKQNFTISQSCTTQSDLQNVCESYDCIVVGSDQVWCENFNGKDSSWFGVETSKQIRWVGYAVSAGKTKYEPSQLLSLVERFSAIGARETELFDSLRLGNKENIAHVLDPTLLASNNLWGKWVKPIVNEPYILTYQARESDDVFRIAHSIARQLGIRRIIPVDTYPNVKRFGFKTYVCSPDQFVSLVKNASCVVTTSFHGTAFSVVLGTPFYSLRLNDGADGRSESFLHSIGLDNRMVLATSNVTYSKTDYTKAYIILKQQQEESLNFLKSSLK